MGVNSHSLGGLPSKDRQCTLCRTQHSVLPAEESLQQFLVTQGIDKAVGIDYLRRVAYTNGRSCSHNTKEFKTPSGHKLKGNQLHLLVQLCVLLQEVRAMAGFVRGNANERRQSSLHVHS